MAVFVDHDQDAQRDQEGQHRDDHDARGFSLDASDFLTKLDSPAGASFTYPSASSGLPYSPLDGKPSIAISPSNGTFGSNYFSPGNWTSYLDAVATAGKATFSGTTAGAAAVERLADPEGAAEAFMRRLIGDERWDGLPERTRATRRAEGWAMVHELADLRLHRPWSAEQIRVPVLTGYGTLGSPHHQTGMRYAADEIDGAQVVELAECRHDAPLSHPALFAEAMVAPLLARLAAP